MTIINKIREKSGWAIGLVAVALIFFIVGTDIFGPNSALFGNKNIVGTIAGQDITYQEFSQELERYKQNFALNVGRQPTEQEMPGIRQQVWDRIIFNVAFQEQFDELGIKVTEDELVDMIQGNNIDPAFASSFTDPETGEVDRNAIQTFLQNIEQYPAQNQVAYREFERSLRPNRLTTKYQNLLGKTYFANTLEAKRRYTASNSRADIRYAFIPYSSIPDSAIEVSESELKAYYNDHKSDFERDPSASFEYVTFPIEATAEDVQYIQNTLQALKPQFERTANDTAFVEANSESSESFLAASPGDIPNQLNVDELEVGKVYGPIREGDFFKLYKVLSFDEDSINYARAKHILIKIDEETDKAAARTKAQDILNQLKNGADFSQMAQQYGEDGTKSRGGDLGWFDENTMVAPFNDAVMEATSPGLLPRLVETEFGFHIIEVTNTKTNQILNLAIVEQEITPSDATINMVYQQLAPFGVAKNIEEFKAAADRDSSLVRYQALDVDANSRSLNNIYDSRIREIIRWAFTDAEVGDVSEIVQLEDQFVVAALRDLKEKGVAPLESVKEQVKAEVLKEKKQQVIMGKLGTVSGTVEEVKDGYGSGATVGSATDINLNSASIPVAGFAPAAIGRAFEMEVGEVSQPIADENGVLVVELDRLDEASEVAEYTTMRQQIASQKEAGIYNKIKLAMEKFSDATNELYKYY